MPIPFQKYLAELRYRKGWTQQEAADALQITQASYSRWELGKSIPSRNKDAKIAETFGVPLAELRKSIEWSLQGAQRVTANSEGETFEERFLAVPILGEVAAGKPKDMDPDSDPLTLRDEVGPLPDGAFAVRVQGYSMSSDSPSSTKSLPSGCVVVCKPADGIPPEDLIGHVVCVRLEGEEHLIKELQREAGKFVLISWNRSFAPIMIDSPAAIEGVALFALNAL